jgi:hypothetical protein
MADPVRRGGTGFTIDEFARWAYPPISRRSLTEIITALRRENPGALQPVGERRGVTGRPAQVLDTAELQRLHAGLAEWLPDDELPPGP